MPQTARDLNVREHLVSAFSEQVNDKSVGHAIVFCRDFEGVEGREPCLGVEPGVVGREGQERDVIKLELYFFQVFGDQSEESLDLAPIETLVPGLHEHEALKDEGLDVGAILNGDGPLVIWGERCCVFQQLNETAQSPSRGLRKGDLGVQERKNCVGPKFAHGHPAGEVALVDPLEDPGEQIASQVHGRELLLDSGRAASQLLLVMMMMMMREGGGGRGDRGDGVAAAVDGGLMRESMISFGLG